MSSTIVSPSLLACNFLKLEEEVIAFKNQENLWLHLDIMDGHFVPNLTFGQPIIKLLSKITTLPLDAHLMVTNPEFYAESLKDYNIHNFTFHWETVNHHDRFIHYLKKYYKSVGVSLNPSTHDELIPDYLLKVIDLVLIMSVNPGFGGQKFVEGTLDKIKRLDQKRKQLGANFQIQVDGGVTNQNASQLKSLGANNLVAGSYIFKSEQSEYINKIKSLR